MPNCQSFIDENGEAKWFNADYTKQVQNEVVRQQMSGQGLRTIAFACKDFTTLNFEKLQNATNNFECVLSIAELESESVFIGLVALKDELRPEISNQLEGLTQRTNLILRLVSGEDLDTCKFIAQETGILQKSHIGVELENERMNRYAMKASDFREIIGGVEESQMNGNRVLLPHN